MRTGCWKGNSFCLLRCRVRFECRRSQLADGLVAVSGGFRGLFLNSKIPTTLGKVTTVPAKALDDLRISTPIPQCTDAADFNGPARLFNLRLVLRLTHKVCSLIPAIQWREQAWSGVLRQTALQTVPAPNPIPVTQANRVERTLGVMGEAQRMKKVVRRFHRETQRMKGTSSSRLIRAVAGYRNQVPRWGMRTLIRSLVLWKGKSMAIVSVGIDLAKNVFAVHCVDETGKHPFTAAPLPAPGPASRRAWVHQSPEVRYALGVRSAPRR